MRPDGFEPARATSKNLTSCACLEPAVNTNFGASYLKAVFPLTNRIAYPFCPPPVLPAPCSRGAPVRSVAAAAAFATFLTLGPCCRFRPPQLLNYPLLSRGPCFYTPFYE
jgi:hypothetical protein